MENVFMCSKCRVLKPLAEFAKRAASSHGHSYRCKECARAERKEWGLKNAETLRQKRRKYREEHPDIVRAYDKRMYEAHKEASKQRSIEYAKRNPEKAKRYRQISRERNPQYMPQYLKQYRERNREKLNRRSLENYYSFGENRFNIANAHAAVFRAIRSGAIVRAATCEECNISCDTQAAHYSYEKGMELEVRWLCHSCHIKWDRAEPKTAPLRKIAVGK